MRAPERIAAKRAAQKRAEARRRFLVPIAAVTAVLAIIGALVAVKLSSVPRPLRPPASRWPPPPLSGRSPPFRPACSRG